MTRPGTFSLARALAAMGVKGGSLPQLSSADLQPVVVTADFSQTQAPEAVEGRAFVSWDNQAGTGPPFGTPQGAHWMGFYFWCLAPGGAVIERLSGNTYQLGTTGPSPPLDAVAANMPDGSWLAGLSNLSPDEFFRHNLGGLPTTTPGLELQKMEIGGVETSSRFLLGGSPSYFTFLTDPLTTDYWEPMNWRQGGASQGGWSVALPPVFELAPNTRWYVPPATGVAFFLHSQSNVAPVTIPGASFSILWREVPEPVGLP